jgi:hypothetical protein
MPFGLSHYAIGIRKDISQHVVNTLSYWLNVLMICNPLDAQGECPNGNLASFYEGQVGTGTECGYILFPQLPNDDEGLSSPAIAGIVVGSSCGIFLAVLLWHRYRIQKQQRQFAKRNQAAVDKAEREREFNEFMVSSNFRLGCVCVGGG